MSFYNRAGVAYAQGAPLGAAVDIAKTADSNKTAQAAGAAFGLSPGYAGTAAPGAYATSGVNASGMAAAAAANQAVEPWAAPNDVGRGVAKKVGGWAMTGLTAIGKPAEWASDAVEANVRTYTGKIREGSSQGKGFFGGFAAGFSATTSALVQSPTTGGLPGIASTYVTPEWQDNWVAAQEAESSPAQTMWEAINSFEQEDPFDLLDNPSRQEERLEYFSSGKARWVTGVVDAGFALFNDPLVVAGGATSAARKTLNTIKATDVAAAARGTDNLTVGARRIDAAVNRVVDASETIRSTNVDGGYAALAESSFLSQTADAGAIPYLLRAADNEVDDAARLQLKRDALYAGMGDRDALARLEQKSADLALEVEALTGPNRQTLIEGVLQRKDFSHLENLRLVDEDLFYEKVVASHLDEIRDTMAGIERTTEVGNPANLTAAQLAESTTVGEIGMLTGTRDVLRLTKTIQRGKALPPVHVVTGRHIPGTFALSADDATLNFKASVEQAEAMFPGSETARNTFRQMLDDFAVAHGSADPAAARAAKRKVVDRFTSEMDRQLAHRIGDGDAAREAQALTIIREIRSKRTAEMAHAVERSYRAADPAEAGVAYTVEPEGIITWQSQAIREQMGNAFDGTQLDEVVSIPSYKDIERTLRARLPKGPLDGFVRGTRETGYTVGEEALAVTNDLWKFSALFRIGYPIRNQVDSQARLIAMMGPLKYAGYAMAGTKNLAHNLRRVAVEEVELAQRKIQAGARIDELVLKHGDDLPAEAAEEMARLQDVLNAKLDLKYLSGKKTLRRNTALGSYVGMGKGRRSAYQNFEQLQREVEQVDARESVLGLMDSARTTSLRGLRQGDATRDVAGSHPQWADAYQQFVNQRVRNSGPMMRMMAGASDEEIAAYYKTDAAGREVWSALSDKYDTVEDLVRVQRQQLDTLLPEGEARSLAGAGPITTEQARKFFKADMRPPVPARALEDTGQNALVKGYNALRSSWFKWAAEVPETMMVRHPFYADRKVAHLTRLAGDVDLDGLTLEQYNRLAQRASVLARRDVGKYLFDTSQRSNLAHSLRFMSPFYSAWSDTMRKWSRIAGEHLEVVPQVPKLFMAPNSVFVVQDNEGNRILRNGDVVDPEGNVVRKSADPTEGSILVPIPEWLPQWANPGGGSDVKVSKGSLNVIFQGDPFWLPGPGPMAAIPVNEVAKRAFPEVWDDGLEGTSGDNAVGGALLRYILPFGVTDDNLVEQSAPMWAKNLATAVRADFDDDRFAQTYAMLMAEEINAQRSGLRETTSQVELEEIVANRTRNWFILRFMGSQAPFSTQPTSRIDFWRSEWQRYQREFGPEAREKFYQDHPDYFEASISLSLNETGISATDESWQEATKYQPQINSNPKYGWMFVGAANMAPGFDAGVYTAQKVEGQRTTKNPVEAFVDLQESKGWAEYQKMQVALDAELQDRAAAGGSLSLRAKSNADLAELRNTYLTDLKTRNVQWANAYDAGGGTAITEFFRTAAQAVEDNPELGQRSDFRTLDQYLLARDAVKELLAERGVSSIEAQGAADVRELWDTYVQSLVESDLGFEQMYIRGGLDRDDLTGE